MLLAMLSGEDVNVIAVLVCKKTARVDALERIAGGGAVTSIGRNRLAV